MSEAGEPSIWMAEHITPFDVYQHGITRVVAWKRTAYQEMAIVESGVYGRALVLDGKWQSCEGDEFLYHEPLVHVACVNHASPERVLILGGGEGATAREALRWRTVREVVMVDIDREVVDACREHLASMHQGAFDDPRMTVRIADALDCLDEYSGYWDVIISDLSDPIEHGPSFRLFTKEYFEKCRRALRSGGFFVIQAGQVSPPLVTMHARLMRTLAAVWRETLSFTSHVATYGSQWGFGMASDAAVSRSVDPAQVDRLLAERTSGALRMFDGATLVSLLNPPKYLREAIAAETRVYTLADPPRFIG